MFPGKTRILAAAVFWFTSVTACANVDPASAGEVRAVATIRPVHSLVAMVTEGLGEPHLLLSGNSSPHDYVMRPSDVRAIASADIIFLVDETFERFLERPLASVSDNLVVVSLSDGDGIRKLPFREAGVHSGTSNLPKHGNTGHGHNHTDVFDPHIWLDPVNAQNMVRLIAQKLSEIDPAGADLYSANASRAIGKLEALQGRITSELLPIQTSPFIAFHDAWQYFEARFGLRAAGIVAINPEVSPGARRVAEIRQHIGEMDGGCVFSEPQFPDKVVRLVTDGTRARIAVLDPLGSHLEAGVEHYPAMLLDIADTMKSCLSGSTQS